MIRALIIEDEENSRSILKTLLCQYCPGVEISGYASDANEAITAIQALAPDLVFLDIELPYGNAFDIIKRLKEINFHIIFTTAYHEYAIKAIKAGAADYLLKPIDYEELKGAVAKIEKKVEEKGRYMDADHLLAIFTKHLYANNLALPTMEGYSFIKLDEIIRITAEGNYCKIYCTNAQNYVITRQIHEVEEKLPTAAFCRVHNSHIISMKHVKEYIKGRGGYVVMSDGSQVDVSFRRKDDFLERLS